MSLRVYFILGWVAVSSSNFCRVFDAELLIGYIFIN